MNRRTFATFVGRLGIASLIAELVPERWITKVLPPEPPKNYGLWEIAPDGTMSLFGQTHFAEYGISGGLTMGTFSYRWKSGSIIETRTRGDQVRVRTIWTLKDGGVFPA